MRAYFLFYASNGKFKIGKMLINCIRVFSYVFVGNEFINFGINSDKTTVTSSSSICYTELIDPELAIKLQCQWKNVLSIEYTLIFRLGFFWLVKTRRNRWLFRNWVFLPQPCLGGLVSCNFYTKPFAAPSKITFLANVTVMLRH